MELQPFYRVTVRRYFKLAPRYFTVWRWGECPGYPNKQAEWRMKPDGTWYKTPFVRFTNWRD